jgi:SAM-dependent methyltransferase/ribosomal protein S27AE
MPKAGLQDFVTSMLRCPRCGSTLRFAHDEQRAYCNGEHGSCAAAKGYPLVNGQPVLVIFEQSVLNEESLVQTDGSSPVRRQKQAGWLRIAARKFLGMLQGGNRIAETNCRRFLEELQKTSDRPIVLNVGGASVGSGAAALHESRGEVRLVCFDVYASPETDFIADAHHIPLADASVDGVWIQAVLEHVLEPERVVAEIHRVLKPGGIVYAEIPFMQTVHEGAYDFTRFTGTGIRWLFRWFDQLDSGVVLGPGSALLWSITASLSGLLRSRALGRLFGTIFFFWVRFLDHCTPKPFAIDAACGLYFFGRKSPTPISPKEAIRAFQGVVD